MHASEFHRLTQKPSRSVRYDSWWSMIRYGDGLLHLEVERLMGKADEQVFMRSCGCSSAGTSHGYERAAAEGQAQLKCICCVGRKVDMRDQRLG